jgi:hypothetical protein
MRSASHSGAADPTSQEHSKPQEVVAFNTVKGASVYAIGLACCLTVAGLLTRMTTVATRHREKLSPPIDDISTG